MSLSRIELRPRLLAIAGLLVGMLASSAPAVTLEVGSASTTPGSAVEIGVRMQAGPSEKVAATQNDIVFNPAVVSVTRRDCRINPNIDKSINIATPSSSSIRIIIISLERSDPIPASDILYTCAFHVGPDAPDGNIALNITNVGAADPNGGKLSASGIGGSIFVSAPASAGGGGMGSQPQMAPAAPPAPAQVQPGGAVNRPAAPGAPAPAPAQVQPGGAVVRPAVPGAPPLPQAEQPVGQGESLPTLGLPTTPTPAAAVPARTSTSRSTPPGTATPGQTTTATAAAAGAKGTAGAKTAAPAKQTPTPKKRQAESED